jgi:hypothetical protein
MSTRKSSRSLTAAVFALALALSGATAQADTLLGVGDVSVRAEQSSEGFLGQAWSWVTEVWTGWFGVTEKTLTEPETTTQSNSCTAQNPCDPEGDAGWGIDPNG